MRSIKPYTSQKAVIQILPFILFSVVVFILTQTLFHLISPYLISIFRKRSFFYLFLQHEWVGSILSLLISITATIPFTNESRLNKTISLIYQKKRWIYFITFTLFCIGTIYIYKNHPLTLDESVPIFQAKAFSQGEISGEMPPALLEWALPATKAFYIANFNSGKIISVYWPGYAILLTPFVLLELQWMLNPIISVLCLIITNKIALRISNNNTHYASLCLLSLLFTPVFICTGISFYTMQALLLFNSAFVLFMLSPSPRNLIIAGVIGSFTMILNNPFPHIFIAIPWIISTIISKNGIKNTVYLALGYLPISILIGIGWHILRASYQMESSIGSSSIIENTYFYAVKFFTGDHARILMVRVMGFLKLSLWGIPGIILFAYVGFRTHKRDRNITLIALSCLSLFFGYFLIKADQGHGWGYRYFHPGIILLILLACLIFTNASEPSSFSALKTYFTRLALLTLLFLVPLRLYEQYSFISDHLKAKPRTDISYNGTQICFIRFYEGYYSIDLIQNDPFLRGNTLYIKSYGFDFEQKFILRYFPSAVPRDNPKIDPVWLIPNQS